MTPCYVTLLGSDFVEEGRKAGRWLLENTKDRTGDINIVELQGTVGSAPANDRKRGFLEIIAAEPRYKDHPLANGRFHARPRQGSHGGVPESGR